MNHILQKEFSPQYSEEPLHKRLTPVELAIGWPSGLQKLLEVGYYADFGLRLSMYMGDLESINIILAAEKFPRDMNAWNLVLTDLKKSNGKIKQVVIQTFLRRRQALADITIKELPEEAIVRLGLLNGKILDAAAPKVYDELQMLNIHIPLKNPAPSYISDEYFSIYHSFFDLYDSGPVPSRKLLDLFYENGFELVDTLDPYMESPLFLACKGFIGRSWSSREVRLIHWFLDKGACPNSSCARSYANLMFYIATSYARSIRDCLQHLPKYFKRLTRRLTSLCDPLCTDGCQCYCSTAGCLSVYKFWKCDDIPFGHGDCESVASDTLFNALYQWLCLCDSDEAQSEFFYKEVFRLEVFDRLGMVHTCCSQQRPSFMDEEERNQLQGEDKELKEQLDLIIQGYQNRYKKHTGGLNDFWKSCLQDLDGILPELIPQERCILRCLSSSDYRSYTYSTGYSEQEREWHDLRMIKEKEALTQINYLELDFIDFIHQYFADSLDPISSNLVEKP